MGGRLSVPQSPDKMSELSKPINPNNPRLGGFNFRKMTAPLAAATMATLLFFYARTSIQAAKLNAQKHREADGGQLSWHKQHLRSHGVIDKVDKDNNFQEALMADLSSKKKQEVKDKTQADDDAHRYSKEEQELRRIMGKDKESRKS